MALAATLALVENARLTPFDSFQQTYSAGHLSDVITLAIIHTSTHRSSISAAFITVRIYSGGCMRPFRPSSLSIPVSHSCYFPRLKTEDNVGHAIAQSQRPAARLPGCKCS